MFKQSVLLCLILISFVGQTYATSCERVRISAHPKYPPYQWAVGDQIVGASVDITTAILKELGVSFVTINKGPWKRVLKAAQDGEIDLILSLKDVAERRNFLTFTRYPFFENPVAVFVNSKRPFAFEGWTDLIGKLGNMNVGDRHGEEFDQFASNFLTIDRVSGLSSNFSMLKLERTDYFITGLYPGRAYIGKAGLDQEIAVLDNRIHYGFVHHGFVKSSPCRKLLHDVDAGLKAKLMNGETKAAMEANLEKWFNSQSGSAE